MLQIISFHDHALVILTLVITTVGYASATLLVNKYTSRFTIEAQEVETI